MRTFLTLILFIITSTCSAESRMVTVQLICDDRDTIFKSITETFKEILQWTGKSQTQNTQSVLTVNPSTGAWTLIEFTQTTACILAAGDNSRSSWGTPVKILFGNKE